LASVHYRLDNPGRVRAEHVGSFSSRVTESSRR
jgi:hypothetical protein